METTIGGISSLSQVAGIACLDQCYGWLDQFVAHLQSNRDYAYERLNQMPGVSCVKPQATFVMFPDVSALPHERGRIDGVFKERRKGGYRTRRKAVLRTGIRGTCPHLSGYQPGNFEGRT